MAALRARATRMGICSADRPRLAAALACGTRQIAPFALERFQDEGFIGLDDPAQPCRFVERRSRQKPVAPAERRATGDAAAFGGFGHALPDDQGLGLRLPTLLLA